jgi:hypothetical protein
MYSSCNEMGHRMTIEKFVYPAVAALTLASVASVPSAASAQAATSPGASDSTGTAVALSTAGAAAVALFAVSLQSTPSTTVVESQGAEKQARKSKMELRQRKPPPPPQRN